MASPFDYWLNLQKAALAGTLAAWQWTSQSWLRLVQEQYHALERLGTRRREDQGGEGKPVARGVKLDDRYGRRHGDVDVEKL